MTTTTIKQKIEKRRAAKRAALMKEVAQAVAVLSMTGAVAVGLAYQAVNVLAK